MILFHKALLSMVSIDICLLSKITQFNLCDPVSILYRILFNSPQFTIYCTYEKLYSWQEILNQGSSKFSLDLVQGPSYIWLTFSFKLNFFAAKAQYINQWMFWTALYLFLQGVGVDLRLCQEVFLEN